MEEPAQSAMGFTMERAVKRPVTAGPGPPAVTRFWGVSVRPGGRGPSVTQTLTSVSAVPRAMGPTRCVRTPLDHTGAFVKRDTMKLHLALAQTLMNVLQTRVAKYVQTLPAATPVAVTQDFDWLEPPSVRIMTSVPPLLVPATRFVPTL